MQANSYNRVEARGYSLVEVLVVVAIVAIIVAVAAPSMMTSPNMQLRSNSREFVSSLRETRLYAITHRVVAIMQINTENRTYRLPGTDEFLALDGESHITLTASADDLISDTLGGIRFFPDGSSVGGRIVLSTDTLIQTIDIEWLTGRVHVLESLP